MKSMNWPERVAYLENQLADSDRDNKRLREFIEGLPDGDETFDELESLRSRLAEARLQKIMARCADLLDEDQFNELDAIARAAVSASEDIVREQRLAEAEALLRVARDCLYATSTSPWAEETVTRIDAHLARKP